MVDKHHPPLLQRTTGEKIRAIPRSALWLIGAMVWTLFFGTIGIIIALFLPYYRRYWFFLQWSFGLLWWTRVACGIRYEIEGEENIPEKPCVVMCKHQSAWETLAPQYWFNPQTWVLKKELLKVPMVGWALGMLSPIAIDRSARKEAMQQMLDQGRARLADGRWIIVYPEGTRIPAGYSGQYRRGGAVLAWETGTPVVPVAHNAGESWPRNSLLKYPGVIRVRIGKPMQPTTAPSADAFLDEIREWIESNTRELSQVYEEPAPSAGASTGGR
ncbi:lysophospholipid acyltransferase family protein [Aquisalimonas asiatica]|uniref:1-acyl-sn-glycerol-3-phosphate acyltransferase n=1 Tax=Aquisalimonas asiatica TaxID=406100 RepID=A0A1H8UBP7_9GAMM|nr:lysophospholipid acyltransferase family protein [Aquisalimonas asiatica]SEP00615.1 1-acyl-sn-glycerol-3-phosphate acyltransferase [Aquisalimonas asiatica]